MGDQNGPQRANGTFTSIRVSVQRPSRPGATARDRHLATGGLSSVHPLRGGSLFSTDVVVQADDYLLLYDLVTRGVARVAPSVVTALRLEGPSGRQTWSYVLFELPDTARELITLPSGRPSPGRSPGATFPPAKFIPDQDTAWLAGIPAGDAPAPITTPSQESFDTEQSLDWGICEWLKICASQP